MLSHWTNGHPVWQKVCRYIALVCFLVTVYAAIVWTTHPTSDNTPSQLSAIEAKITETNQKLDKLISLLESQGFSDNITSEVQP